MPSSVVLETGQQLVIVFDAARPGVSLRGGGAGFWQVETDAGLPFHVDVVVERGPVLPAVTVAEMLFVDHTRSEFPLSARGEADGGHQATDQQGLLFADRRAPGRCEQALPDAGKATAAFLAVEAVRIDRGAGRQHALKIGGQAGEQQRRALGPVSAAAPHVGVAAQRAGVVLEFARLEGVATQDQQVHFVPAAAVVAELEVGPGRGPAGRPGADS